MKKLKTALSAFLMLGFGLTGLMAQQTVPASGGNASGSGGTASYTVGQVVYTSNTGTSGSVMQGVQIPYEIYTVGIEEVKGINLECAVFPNPTNYILKLKIENYTAKNLWYQLYDINGKLLQNKKAENSETNISMESFVPATYFLKVTDNNKEIKSFKIIKTK